MDVEKYWIYLLLAVFYGLSRLLKKDPAKPEDAPEKKASREAQPRRRGQFPGQPTTPRTTKETIRREPPKPKQQPKAMTFEELMREIMEGKMPPVQEPVVDYDDQIGEDERSLEDVNYDRDVNVDRRNESEVVAVYEQAKKEAFSRPSLEETMKVGDTDVSFGKFREFERTKKPNLAEVYLNDFRDLDQVRKAVVMSEILRPKF